MAKSNRRSFLGQVLGSMPIAGALALITGETRAQTRRPTGLTDDHDDDLTGFGVNPWPYVTGLNDSDNVDRFGQGRGTQGRAGPVSQYTGITDADIWAQYSGRGQGDQSGWGRGQVNGTVTRPTGFYDSDSGDRGGYGRGTYRPPDQQPPSGYTGVTDRDPTDRQGYGRGTGGAQPAQPYTGVTDRDPTDQSGYGRGGAAQQQPGYTGVTDADSGSGADRAGYGRGTQAPGYTGRTDSDPSDRAGYGRTGH
jgi:hypothetical protein